MGSNPTLSYVILGLKISFWNLKTQKGIFICPKLLPKAKKFKKQKINSEPLRTTVLAHSWILDLHCMNFGYSGCTTPELVGMMVQEVTVKLGHILVKILRIYFLRSGPT